MRRSNGNIIESRLAQILLLAVITLAGILFGYWLRGVQQWHTRIPNDCFAVQGSTGEDEAQQAMMLKIACLTFDDGPSKNTMEILKILKRYEVPATFFVTAQEENLPYLPLLRTAEEQGHQIGLHSATHSYSKIYQSSRDFWLDIKTLRKTIDPYVNLDKVNWLRFPGGSTNTVSHKYGGRSIMKQLIREAEEKGYEWIDWNVCAEDATATHPNAAKIMRNIKSDADGRDICVVLLHDTKATGQTVKALPEMIEWFTAEGYHFCTVADMYAMRSGD